MMIRIALSKACYRHSAMLLSILLISGCGEFAFKRGASSSDLDIAKKSCRAKSSDPAILEKCMIDNGWIVQNLGKMEPIDADPVIEASVIPSDRRIENASNAPANKQGATGDASPDQPQPAATVKKVPNMMDTFKVSSWWKTGSGAEGLKTDTEECVFKLGEAHRPDNQTQYVTRGLLLCMKEKGWSGLRAK